MTQQKYSYNLLQNNGFQFSIQRLPQTMFRVVACDLPAISIPQANTGGYPGANQSLAGNTAEFEELTMDFLVDEDLKNYEEIYNWIVGQQFEDRDKTRRDVAYEQALYSDGTLITLDNSSNPHRVFSFKSLFPINLGNLHFDTSVTEPVQVTCQVTFKYAYFKLQPMDYIKGVVLNQ